MPERSGLVAIVVFDFTRFPDSRRRQPYLCQTLFRINDISTLATGEKSCIRPAFAARSHSHQGGLECARGCNARPMTAQTSRLRVSKQRAATSATLLIGGRGRRGRLRQGSFSPACGARRFDDRQPPIMRSAALGSRACGGRRRPPPQPASRLAAGGWFACSVSPHAHVVGRLVHENRPLSGARRLWLPFQPYVSGMCSYCAVMWAQFSSRAQQPPKVDVGNCWLGMPERESPQQGHIARLGSGWGHVGAAAAGPLVFHGRALCCAGIVCACRLFLAVRGAPALHRARLAVCAKRPNRTADRPFIPFAA